MEQVLRIIKNILPERSFLFVQPRYHYLLALLGAIFYRFPSREIKVVAVTGTKGKSSVVELTNAILEEAGFKTAILSTIRFKIGERSEPNLYKMTTPGRFFVQKFLRQAVKARCDWAVLEMTSEAAKQFRHRFIDFDVLIFTNLAPEHIESHGSYEKYLETKLGIARALSRSQKRPRSIIANADDKEGEKFLALGSGKKFPFSLEDTKPYALTANGLWMTFGGEEIHSKLEGIFNIYNILAAATFAKSQGIAPAVVKRAIEKVRGIRGRVEHIEAGALNLRSGKQNFSVIVDYAHTPDSLEKLYKTFLPDTPRENSGSISKKKLICVLGNTGGGRDRWKRPEMGRIADRYCDKIILTNEDPYDEDPRAILADMEKGFSKHKPEIILDRREAIRRALRLASFQSEKLAPSNSFGTSQGGDKHNNLVVLITGKGTDPYIMGPNGSKIPWDDATVVREELRKFPKKENFNS